GALALGHELPASAPAPPGRVAGGPSSMRVIRGHKSMNVFRVDFHGVAAHSSLTPEGVNAIAYASEFVALVHAVAAEFRTEGHFDEAYVVPYTTDAANTFIGGNAINTIPAYASVTFEFLSLCCVDLQSIMTRLHSGDQR